jgi:hypothetical protein
MPWLIDVNALMTKNQIVKKNGLKEENQRYYYKQPHFELKFGSIIIYIDLLVKVNDLWKLFKQNGEWLNIMLSNVLGTME